MRRRVPFGCLIWATACLINPAQAVPTLPSNSAASSRIGLEGLNITILRAQVLLDRAGFGPGVLDGRKGRFFSTALAGFQHARGLPVTGQLDAASQAALRLDTGATIIRMTLKEDAFRALFTPDIPARIHDQAALPYLGYRNLLEKLAERFHTTPQTLLTMNPALATPRAGMALLLPGILPANRDYPETLSAEWREMLATLNIDAVQPKAKKIVVDKSESVLKVYDDQEKLVAQFPATLGSAFDPLPLGDWVVKGAAFMPTYHYSPDLFWDADSSDAKATLKPGPNSPVGVVWIDLNIPHYGIHGTPEPSRIGRSQSHGCVRLSNWDAARLAQMISPATPAVFQL